MPRPRETLEIVQINQHAEAVEPLHADFIWKFSGFPELWLADSFPAGEPSSNGKLPYFSVDLLSVFANHVLKYSDNDKILLHLSGTDSENFSQVLASAALLNPSSSLFIHLPDGSHLEFDDLKKFFSEKIVDQLNIITKSEVSEQTFDKIIVYSVAESEDSASLSYLAPSILAPGGRLIVCNLGNSSPEKNEFLTELVKTLKPVEFKLPIGKSVELGIIFAPEDCDWGPGHICLFEK